MVFAVVGGDGKPTGYEIENSLRLNDGDSPDLDRAVVAGNRDIFTFSTWFKRSTLKSSGEQFLFAGSTDGSNNTEMKLQNDQITFITYDGSSNISYVRGSAKLRDVSAWYHVVYQIDTTLSNDDAATYRVKIWINGSQVTTLDQNTFQNRNTDTMMNANGGTHRIGADARTAANFFDGYIAETHYLDGTAYDASYFGETDDNGVWIPKEYTGGNYGANGFYLPFDNKGKIHSISVVGNTHHETDQKKFGDTSIYFDGSGDELHVNDIGQLTFDGDFTVEFFAYLGDQGDTYATIMNDVTGGNKLRINLGSSSNSTPKLSIYSSTWDSHISGTSDIGDSAWHHCAVVRDNGTIRIFVDGTQETTSADKGNFIDVSGVFEIGTYSGSKAFTGYLDEIRISNIARYTSNFTPTTSIFSDDENTRLLIHSDSTDGNTSFSDSSGVAGGIGNDNSGENHDYTSLNLNSQIDVTTDTPTNNFCTLNPLDNNEVPNGGNHIYAEGNTKFTATAGNNDTSVQGTNCTMAVANGKWYWEAEIDVVGPNYPGAGILAAESHKLSSIQNGYAWNAAVSAYGYQYLADGQIGNNDSSTSSGWSAWNTAGKILMIALDMDNNKIYYGQNGTWDNSGDPTSGSTGTGAQSVNSSYSYLPHFHLRAYDGSASPGVFLVNFGNPPFAISSGNADANGYGNFEYAVPSGYYSLCTKNLAEYG